MLKKTIILTQFGSPHVWTEQFLENVGKLGQYGWYWKIFTENKYDNVPENVKIVPMNTEQFNDLVQEKLGVRPNMFMTSKGVPSVHVTDFYVFSGLIFEDWLKDSDYWGIANIDIVFGRLDHFLPDSELEKWDVWTDDVNVFNGIFSLLKNTKEVNELCLEIPLWKEKIAQGPCNKCLGLPGETSHSLAGTDEYDMTEVLKRPDILEKVKYGYPLYHFMHSYDRLEQHVPEVKLEIQPDGSLWELFTDTAAPDWIHTHSHAAREIAYFHFIRTKAWPNIIMR